MNVKTNEGDKTNELLENYIDQYKVEAPTSMFGEKS